MEISDKQNIRIKELAQKHHLRLVLLFGSRVTGKIHKESDFDVAYLSEKKLSYDDEVDINFQFTNIFRHDRVDTVDIKRASPLLMFGIFRQCQVLFEIDNLVFPTYRVYAFKKYIEAKPYYEEKFDKLRNKIKLN